MTKKQFAATSMLGAIPAAGLIAALAMAALGGADFSFAMWGLFGATLLAGIVTLATPVAVFLLIPAEEALAGGSGTGCDIDEEHEDEPGESTSFKLDSDEDTAGGEINEFAEDDELDDDDDFDVQDDYNAAETEVATSDELNELSDDDFDDAEDFEIGDDFDDEFDDFDDDEDFV